MNQDSVAGQRPSTAAVVRSLYGGTLRGAAVIGPISVAALLGGLAEAAFLVLVTKTGLAVTAQRDTVAFVGDIDLTLYQAVAIAAVFLVGKVVSGVAAGRMSAKATSSAVAEVRRNLTHAYLSARWEAQQAAGSGQLQDLLTSFADKIYQLLGSITTLILAGLNLVALLALSVAVDPLASVLVIVMVGGLATVLRPLRRVIRRRAARSSTLNLDFAGSLNEISELGMEFQVFHVQEEAERKIESLISKSQRSSERLAFAQSLTPTIYTGLAYFAVLAALGGVVAIGRGEVESLSAVMLIMLRSLSYGQSFQVASSTLEAALPYHAVLERRLADYRAAERTDEGRSVPAIQLIQFRNVDFEYSPGSPVLRDLDFSIGPREVIGIMGPSGGGKSTLVQLLLGLREPTKGRVCFDGVDVSDFARDDLARRVTFVPQEPHLFEGSVEENIRFMRSDVSLEQIEIACRSANLWSDIEGFDDGLNRQVGVRGGQLSGGQKQRLCIARALVEQPDVLVLDEPTSALDVKSEQLVRSTLEELAATMTVVIVAHRLSTLDFCDRIMVVQDGSVLAFGPADVLERENKFFKEALEIAGMRPDSTSS